MAFADTNKAHSAAMRHIVRMDECSAFRKGTLGIATRNARRTVAAIRRRALRDRDVFALEIAEGLRDATRWGS